MNAIRSAWSILVLRALRTAFFLPFGLSIPRAQAGSGRFFFCHWLDGENPGYPFSLWILCGNDMSCNFPAAINSLPLGFRICKRAPPTTTTKEQQREWTNVTK